MDLDDEITSRGYFSETCSGCNHFKGLYTCDAFKDNIPDEIWNGKNPHTDPFEGDNGILFEPLKKADTPKEPELEKKPEIKKANPIHHKKKKIQTR